MNSNYMFAFNRMQMGPPAARSLAPAPAPAPSPSPSPSPAPKSPNGPGDRFSINRLINYKSAGGCRSCN